MSSKNKHKGQGGGPSKGRTDEQGTTDSPAVQASGWSEGRRKPVYKPFPGPQEADAPVRVSITRQAYADFVAHTKDSLEAEVCGVLAGWFGEDDLGLYVVVEAAVRGATTRSGGTHVTYTQETWNRIHETMEKNHPRLQIVGWYHSHPGFGVEFSDMDLFIQRNFFSGPGQIGLVGDPLGGEEAICVNLDGQVRHLDRCWIDGRERKLSIPKTSGGGSTDVSTQDGELAQRLEKVEQRLAQVLRVVDEQRTSYLRFLFFVGSLVAFAILAWVGLRVTDMLTDDGRPVMQAFAPDPVKINGKWCFVGAQPFVKEVPQPLAAALDEAERRMIEERQKAAAEGQAGGQGNAAAPAQGAPASNSPNQ